MQCQITKEHEIQGTPQQVCKGWLEIPPCGRKPLCLHKGRQILRAGPLPRGEGDRKRTCKQANQEVRGMIPRTSRLKKRDMEKIIMVIEKSKDFYDAYSENCEGIYAAGGSIDDVKKDTEAAISLIKRDYPESEWPAPLRGEYEIEWKMDVQSFLEYYKDYLSLSGLEKITGINQKQLSNYLNRRARPRKKQVERISEGLRKFASELLSVTL